MDECIVMQALANVEVGAADLMWAGVWMGTAVQSEHKHVGGYYGVKVGVAVLVPVDVAVWWSGGQRYDLSGVASG